MSLWLYISLCVTNAIADLDCRSDAIKLADRMTFLFFAQRQQSASCQPAVKVVCWLLFLPDDYMPVGTHTLCADVTHLLKVILCVLLKEVNIRYMRLKVEFCYMTNGIQLSRGKNSKTSTHVHGIHVVTDAALQPRLVTSMGALTQSSTFPDVLTYCKVTTKLYD